MLDLSSHRLVDVLIRLDADGAVGLASGGLLLAASLVVPRLGVGARLGGDDQRPSGRA